MAAKVKENGISNEELIELYVNQNKSVKEIASLYNYSLTNIYKRLERIGLSAQNIKNESCKLKGRFGSLEITTILEERDKKGHIQYLCKCDCGKEIVLSRRKLTEGTKYCDNYLCQRKHKKWMGCGEIHKTYWNVLQRGAKERELNFNITIEFAWDLFLKQDRKCKLTGIELTFPRRYHDFNGTASLDRINSNIGYEETNVQWIHKSIQDMKFDKDELDFIKWCGIIWEYSKDRLQ